MLNPQSQSINHQKKSAVGVEPSKGIQNNPELVRGNSPTLKYSIKEKKDGSLYVQRHKICSLSLPLLKLLNVGHSQEKENTPKKEKHDSLLSSPASVEPWISYTLLGVAFVAGFLFLPPLLPLLLPAFLLSKQVYCLAPRPRSSYLFFSFACLFTFLPGILAYYGSLSFWFLILEKIWVSLGNSEIITHYQFDTLLSLFRAAYLSLVPFSDFFSWNDVFVSSPEILIIAITPAYGIMLLFFFYSLPKENNSLIQAYLETLTEIKKKSSEEMETQTSNQWKQNEIVLQAIAAHEIILLGEELDRHWKFPEMKWAFSARPKDDLQMKFLTVQNLLYHVISCGATRAGKSVNLAKPIIQFAIANRFGMVIIDPKGDLLKPEDSSFNFSVVEGEKDKSYRFCVIDDRVTWTTAARNFAEAVIDSDDSSPDSLFFIAWARRALAAVMLAHRIIFDQWPELIKVLEYAADPVTIGSLVSKLKQIQYDSKVVTSLRQTSMEVLLELKSLVNLVPGRSKTNPFETVANSIQAMATDKFANCLTTNSACGVTIRQILEESLTARFSYNLSEGEVSRQLNRVVIRQFTTIALEPAIKREPPRFLLVDEASEVICEALGTLVTKGAGRQAGAILLFQNLSQIRKSKLAHDIFANCRTKLVLTGTSGETAQIFSELTGYCSLPMLTSNENSSEGHTTGSARSSGSSRGQNLVFNRLGQGATKSQGYQTSFTDNTSQSTGQSRGEGKVFVERVRWNASEIMNLPRFHALGWFYDGTGDVEMHLLKFISPDERARLTLKTRVPQPQVNPLQTLTSFKQSVTILEESVDETEQNEALMNIIEGQVIKQEPENKQEKPSKRKRNRNSRHKASQNIQANKLLATNIQNEILPDKKITAIAVTGSSSVKSIEGN